MIFQDVSFTWQGFVKNAARISVQQTVEDIAKILISAHDPLRSICGLHCILSSKLNKTLSKFITSFCQCNTAFFIFTITVY